MLENKLVSTKGWKVFSIVALLAVAALMSNFDSAKTIWTVAVSLSIFLMIIMALNKSSALFDIAVWIVFYTVLYKIIAVTGLQHEFAPIWFIFVYLALYFIVSGILYKQAEPTKYIYSLALIGWFVLIERHLRIDGWSWGYYGEIPRLIRDWGYPGLSVFLAISALATFVLLKNRNIILRVAFSLAGTMFLVMIVGSCLEKQYLFTIFVVADSITLTFFSPAANKKISSAAEKTVDKIKEKIPQKKA